MNQYFLQDDAGIEEINAQALASGLRDGNRTGGIAAKHIPTPFRREVSGMDGAYNWFAVAELDGIARIASLIDVECRQGADFYLAVSLLDVKLVFHKRSRRDFAERIGWGVERLDKNAVGVS